MEREEYLSIREVCYSYHSLEGETPALQGLSFSVAKGEFVAVVGPSGCGKSTLLSLIAGLLPAESGSITLSGVPVMQARHKIGYMLQRDHLLEWRSTYRNVMLGPEIKKETDSRVAENVEKMLELYGLKLFRHAKPNSLSGGMRQRAALIRTLACRPELLLLDEPFSALDYQTRLAVSDDICGILRQEGMTAILITHDISEAVSIADRVVVLGARPATVRCQLPIHLTAPEPRTPLHARSAPEFKDYFNLIWKELTQA